MLSDPVSVVLLLREPRRLNADDVTAASHRAFPNETVKPLVVEVAPKGDSAIVAVGPHMVNLLSAGKPYLHPDAADFAKRFEDSKQQAAWAEHRAWIALDYTLGSKDLQTEYVLLGRLAAELLDSDCCAVFIPGKGLLLPAEDRIVETFKKLLTTG